jgi:small subunit ribosomal protein S8e
MVVDQSRPKRKETGARYKAYRKRRQHDLGRQPSFTKVEERRVQSVRTIGDNKKVKLLSTDIANLFDPKSKKYEKAKIKTIVENPANRHFVRRNILTKGSIVETDKGKAKITSRPGQDGSVNAILIS